MSGVLGELGCHVIDADVVAREVVAPGTEGLRRVAEAFGPGVLTHEGALDRKALGAIVFADAELRGLLNSILHPLIMAVQDGRLREYERADPEGVAVVDAALMIESGGYKRFDRLIVVHCRPEVQLKRLVERDGISAEAAASRIAAQMPQGEKLRYADFAIDTSHGFEDTRRRAGEVYAALRDLAMKKSAGET